MRGLVALEMRGKLAGTMRYLARNATSQDVSFDGGLMVSSQSEQADSIGCSLCCVITLAVRT
jgi:hypothetical protein